MSSKELFSKEQIGTTVIYEQSFSIHFILFGFWVSSFRSIKFSCRTETIGLIHDFYDFLLI
jgi:hypothetical protein